MERETMATGFVRPKTTSLFFDRIWLPRNLGNTYFGDIMGYSDIPDSVMFNDKRFKEFYSIDEAFSSNVGYTYHDSIDFLFSGSRNDLILKIVKAFKKIYNINIIPIFFDKTRFEKMILEETNFKMKRYEEKIFCDGVELLFDNADKAKINKKIKNVNKQKEIDVNAIEVCIKFIPEIVEDKLEWKQVDEIRKDKESVKSLRRFWMWYNRDFKNMTHSEIREILELELDNYKFALKKHGILTVIGGFSTILSSVSTILTVLSSSEVEIVSAGLAISAGILTFSSTQVAEIFQSRREPIAYIYKLNKLID